MTDLRDSPTRGADLDGHLFLQLLQTPDSTTNTGHSLLGLEGLEDSAKQDFYTVVGAIRAQDPFAGALVEPGGKTLSSPEELFARMAYREDPAVLKTLEFKGGPGYADSPEYLRETLSRAFADLEKPETHHLGLDRSRALPSQMGLLSEEERKVQREILSAAQLAVERMDGHQLSADDAVLLEEERALKSKLSKNCPSNADYELKRLIEIAKAKDKKSIPIRTRLALLKLPAGHMEILRFLIDKAATPAEKDRLSALIYAPSANAIRTELGKLPSELLVLDYNQPRFKREYDQRNGVSSVPLPSIFGKKNEAGAANPNFRPEAARYYALNAFKYEAHGSPEGSSDPQAFFSCFKPPYVDALAIYVGDIDGWGLTTPQILAEMEKVRSGKLAEANPKVQGFLQELYANRGANRLDSDIIRLGQWRRAKDHRAPTSEERMAFLGDTLLPASHEQAPSLRSEREGVVKFVATPTTQTPSALRCEDEDQALKSVLAEQFPAVAEALVSSDPAKLVHAWIAVNRGNLSFDPAKIPLPEKTDPRWKKLSETVVPSKDKAAFWDRIKQDPIAGLGKEAAPAIRRQILSRLMPQLVLSAPKAAENPLPGLTPETKAAREQAVSRRIEDIQNLVNYAQRNLVGIDALFALQSASPETGADAPEEFRKGFLAFNRAMESNIRAVPGQFVDGISGELDRLLSGLMEEERLKVPMDAFLLHDRISLREYHRVGAEKDGTRQPVTPDGSPDLSNLAKEEAFLKGVQARHQYFAQQGLKQKRLEALGSQNEFLTQFSRHLGRLGPEVLPAAQLKAVLDQLGRINAALTVGQKAALLQTLGNFALYCQSKPDNCSLPLRESVGLMNAMSLRDFETLNPLVYQQHLKTPNESKDPFLGDNRRLFSKCLLRDEPPREVAKTEEPKPEVAPLVPFKLDNSRPDGPSAQGPTAANKDPIWGLPETFITEDGKPKSAEMRDGSSPFFAEKAEMTAEARQKVWLKNEARVAEALDDLANPALTAEDLQKRFGAYYQSRFGQPMPTGPLSPVTAQKLRFALVSDLFEQAAAASGTAQRSRLLAALSSLPGSDGTVGGLRKALDGLFDTSTKNEFQLAAKFQAVNDWLIQEASHGVGNSDSRMSRLLGLVSSTLDDYWDPTQNKAHADSASTLRMEGEYERHYPELAELRTRLQTAAVNEGKFLYGSARHWAYSSPETIQAVSDLGNTLLRYEPKALVSALTDAGGDAKRASKVDELHKLWGRFALEPNADPMAADFKPGNLNTNRVRALAMETLLRKYKFNVGELEQMLGTYLKGARLVSPYEMALGLDPNLGIYNTKSHADVLKQPVKDEDKEGMIAELLMDARGIGAYLRRNNPVPMPGQTPNPKRDELTKKFAESWPTTAEMKATIGSLKYWAGPEQGGERTRQEIQAKFGFLTDHQSDQLNRALSVLRKLPKRDLPSDAEIMRVIATEVFRTYSNGEVGAEKTIPAVLKPDADALLETVRSLHELVKSDRPVLEADLAGATKGLKELLGQASLVQDPESGLKNWILGSMNRNMGISGLLTDLFEYRHPWVKLDSIENVLTTLDPRLRDTDPLVREQLRNLARILKASRWLEDKENPTDAEIEKAVSEASFGVTPDQKTPEEMAAEIKRLSSWVKLSLHIAKKAPTDRKLDQDLASFIPAERTPEAIRSDAHLISEFFKISRTFSPRDSDRAQLAKLRDQGLDHHLIDTWVKALQVDMDHLAGVAPHKALDAIRSSSAARDEILGAISLITRHLKDDPVPFSMTPKKDAPFSILADRFGRTHRIEGLYPWIKDQLNETDEGKYTAALMGVLPIGVKDVTDDAPEKAPLVGDKNELFAQALSVLRCRLLEEVLRLQYGYSARGGSSQSALLHFDNDVRKNDQKLGVLYAKVIRDVEVKLLEQYSDAEVDMKAFRDKLKSTDPVAYLNTLRERTLPSEAEMRDGRVVAVPGCVYQDTYRSTASGGPDKKGPGWILAGPNRAFSEWAREELRRGGRDGVSEILRDDNRFLSALSGELSQSFGPYAGFYRPQNTWTAEKTYPALHEWGYSVALQRGKYPTDGFAPRDPPPAVLAALAELPKEKKEALTSQLEAAKKEALRKDKAAENLVGTGPTFGVRTVHPDHDVEEAGKALRAAHETRKAIYDSILETHAQSFRTPASPIPAGAEAQLMKLSLPMRELLSVVLFHERDRAAVIEAKLRELDRDPKANEKEITKLRSEVKAIHLLANRLILVPDVSTLASVAWKDPKLRMWLLDKATPRLSPPEEGKAFTDLTDKLRRWDKLLLKPGEEALSLEEREAVRDQFERVLHFAAAPSSGPFEETRGSNDRGKKAASHFVSLLLRMTEEAGSLEFARKNSGFAKDYEAVMGGDARFTPQATLGELQSERRLAHDGCAGDKATSLTCVKLNERLKKMDGLGRGLSTQARLRYLTPGEDQLQEGDFHALERLENDLLPQTHTQNDKAEGIRLTQENLMAFPSKGVIDQASRNYDLGRFLYRTQNESVPRVSEEVIERLVKVAQNGKAQVFGWKITDKGPTLVVEEKACETIKPLPENPGEVDTEVIADVVMSKEDSEVILGGATRLANYQAFQTAYEGLKLSSPTGQEPDYAEVMEKAKPIFDEKRDKLLTDLVTMAARRYLQIAIREAGNPADLRLSAPNSKAGCALRALLGKAHIYDIQKVQQDVFRSEKIAETRAAGKGDGTVSPKEMGEKLERFMSSPEFLVEIERKFEHEVAFHDGTQEQTRPVFNAAVTETTLKDGLGACYDSWKKGGKTVPAITRQDDPRVLKLATAIEAETLAIRSLHQMNQVEADLRARAAETTISDTAADLSFFSDPKTGLVTSIEKQLARFKNPKLNPELNTHEMKKTVERLEEQLASHKSNASRLTFDLYRNRLRVEAALNAPLDGPKTQEEILSDIDSISRIKSLYEEESNRLHLALPEDRRPPFAAFPPNDFFGNVYDDPQLRGYVERFVRAKLAAVAEKRKLHQVPEGYDPRLDEAALIDIKLQSLIRKAGALKRSERMQKMEEELGKMATAQDQSVILKVQDDFDQMAVHCMELLADKGRWPVFTDDDGKHFDLADIAAVRNHIMAFEAQRAGFKALVSSLLPPPGVKLAKDMDGTRAFEHFVASHPTYKEALIAMQGNDSLFPLNEAALHSLEKDTFQRAFDERNQEEIKLKESLEGLAELGFQWNGTSLQWGQGKDGLKLHLIGPKGKIKSLAELKARLEGLRAHGAYKLNGNNPWSLLMEDIWLKYSNTGFKPLIEFGNSAICMMSFLHETDEARADGIYSQSTGREQNLPDHELCFDPTLTKVSDKHRVKSARLGGGIEDQKGISSTFLSDMGHAEKYLAFMSLEDARARATKIAAEVKAGMSGEANKYDLLRKELMGQSSNMFAAFQDLDQISWERNPQGNIWMRNLGWTSVKGAANALDKSWGALGKLRDTLASDISRLEALGGITIDWQASDHTVQQPASSIAQMLRQQQKYVTDPDFFKNVPREVMENIDALQEFYTEMLITEIATAGLGGVFQAARFGLRGAMVADAAKYAVLAERLEKGMALTEHVVKGVRSAYRFGIGGKVVGDLISKLNEKERGYMMTQSGVQLRDGARKSRWVFGLLPLTGPVVQSMAQLSGVPAHLIPWVAGPLSMGGTHYGVEIANGHDPLHSLIGTVPMAMFGLPVSRLAGGLYANGMKQPILGSVLRPTWVQKPLMGIASYGYFASVTATGGALSHYLSPGINRDEETGELVYTSPFTGKEVKDATILKIMGDAVFGNIGMDMFFARNHIAEVQSNAAASLFRSGTSYRQVIDTFSGGKPQKAQQAHQMLIQGLAHTSVSEIRNMRQKAIERRREVEKNPLNVEAARELEGLEQSLSLFAKTAGHGEKEFGTVDEAAINSFMTSLEAHTKGGLGNRPLMEVVDKMSFELAVAKVSDLKKKDASLDEWLALVKDPIYQGSGASSMARIMILPPEIIQKALASPKHKEAFFPVLEQLAGIVSIRPDRMGSFGEFMTHYRPKGKETLLGIAQKFNRAKPGQYRKFLADGSMTYLDLIEGFENERTAILDGFTVDDVRVIVAQANETSQTGRAKAAKVMLELLASRHQIDVPLFVQAIAGAAKDRPAVSADAKVGTDKGWLKDTKLINLAGEMLPRAARALRDQVKADPSKIDQMMGYAYFQVPQGFVHVPLSALRVGSGSGPDAKPADPKHLQFLDLVSAHHAKIDSTFSNALYERGVSVGEFQLYFREFVRNKAGLFSNPPDAARQAKLDFMAAIRSRPKPGETKMDGLQALTKEWNEVEALITADPKDPAAVARLAKIEPTILALAERSGFVDGQGGANPVGLFHFLEQARAEKAPKEGPDSRTVAQLMPEAQRLARLDMVAKARDGSLSVEALLTHDLFLDPRYQFRTTGKLHFRPEALAMIPQDVVLRAYQKAVNPEQKRAYAEAIVRIAQESGYVPRHLEEGFLNFLVGYRGSRGATVVDLAQLYQSGHVSELGHMLASGALDLGGLEGLPDSTANKVQNTVRALVRVELKPSRAEEVLDSLTVESVGKLVDQAKNPNHPNSVNARNIVRTISHRMGTEPEYFETFFADYRKGKESSAIYDALGQFMGIKLDPRQLRTMKDVAPYFWKASNEAVRNTLEARPEVLEKLATTSFFAQENPFRFLPTSALRLTETKRMERSPNSAEVTEVTVPSNAIHHLLIDKAGSDAVRNDAVFLKALQTRQVEGVNESDAFVAHLKQVLIGEPGKYRNVSDAVEAAKKSYLLTPRSVPVPKTSSLLRSGLNIVERRFAHGLMVAV